MRVTAQGRLSAMNCESLLYVHLPPNGALPDISAYSPFRAVLVIEEVVAVEWQLLVSDWLVDSGCLYMMAWGIDCSSWDDSVDYSNILTWDCEEIPDEASVMTTWHERDSLEEVFGFCKDHANHSVVELRHTLIIHVSIQNEQEAILERFRVAD